ncbi:MAG: cytosine permease [Acidobacteriaceae bacterium]|nr:cytosine permease [Acidobacteriaceae bacterium]
MPNLPDYISKTVPNPTSNRAPWYANTAPSYAGVFLWVVFYQQIAVGTLDHAGPLTCLLALIVAGLLSYGLYYFVPAMLGMRTGYPLYVVGSSTFGTAGGYLMPGLLMGLLQIGWFAVGTFFSTQFILKGLHMDATPGTITFGIVAALWCYIMAYVGVKGIQYVAKVSLFLNFIPLLVILVVFFQNAGTIGNYTVPQPTPFIAFVTLLQAVIGFFATAGAAGADFGMNSRNVQDVKWGGLVGVTLASVIAGGLPILAVAGAHGKDPNLPYNYDAIISTSGGFLASAMFLLFAVASIVPACFCAFIAGNSFSTMLPGVPRMSSTMIGCTVALILAITGVAANLAAVFSIVGASFGPICGAMVADYLLSGKKWAGPREGVNLAGYAAWALGFIVGILPFLPLPPDVAPYVQPAVVYSFITGFIVYTVVAKLGGQPRPVPAALAARLN